MRAPLIGITSYRHSHQKGFSLISSPEAYIQAVSKVGGIPVLIPLGLPEDQLFTISSRLDGIIFSGGGDIDPILFGGEPHHEVSSVDSDRDRVELQLVQNVLQNRTPFLGICRGIQVVNVALGGTLYTHVPDQLPGKVHHPHMDEYPRDFLAHEVQIQPGSQIFEIMGQHVTMVNSLHHQGIDLLGDDLQATAHAPDGLIEGIEMNDYPFGIAVQWHPEWLIKQAPMRALFQSLVQASSK